VSGRRVLVAVLCGIAACIVLMVLGEVAIGMAGRQVLRWMADGVPLTGWRQTFVGISNFFARYFAIMSPLVFLLSVSGALFVARVLSRHAAA
jgi:hypothetical protein